MTSINGPGPDRLPSVASIGDVVRLYYADLVVPERPRPYRSPFEIAVWPEAIKQRLGRLVRRQAEFLNSGGDRPEL